MNDETSTSLSTEAAGPQDIALEMALLNVILADNQVFAQLDVGLKPCHFADARNAAIFCRIVDLIDQGVTATSEALLGYCWADDNLQEEHINGVVELRSGVDKTIAAKELAQRLIKLSFRRNLVELGNNVVLAAYTSGQDASLSEIVEMANSALYNIMECHSAISEAKCFHYTSQRIIGQVAKQVE